MKSPLNVAEIRCVRLVFSDIFTQVIFPREGQAYRAASFGLKSGQNVPSPWPVVTGLLTRTPAVLMLSSSQRKTA